MAVQYVTIGDLAENLIVLSETNSVGLLLAAWIQTWIDENGEYCELELSLADLNALLKALTGCVVATGTTLSCYPLGLVTAILFDINGNPVP